MRKSETPDTAETDARRLAFDFFTEVGILAQLSQTRLERRLPDGITNAHFGVLSHMIRQGDGKTPSTLAQIMQVPKASMTNTLAGLESRGLIDVQPNPKDGRSRIVYLTDAGRLMREDALRLIAPEFELMSHRFDIARLAEVMPLLMELREVMDLYRDEDNPND